jgi:hypothetical protein
MLCSIILGWLRVLFYRMNEIGQLQVSSLALLFVVSIRFADERKTGQTFMACRGCSIDTAARLLFSSLSKSLKIQMTAKAEEEGKMEKTKRSSASILRRPAVFAAMLAPAIRVNQAMRTMRSLLLAGMLPLFLSSPGHAQTIYSSTFNGGAVNINQKPPTVATDDAGAASSAIWRDAANTKMLYTNGTVNTAAGDSVLLPFTPENGYVYTLTASVTLSGDPGSWIGAGFAQNYSYAGSGKSQFNQSGINGYDWAILTESSGNVQYFAGPSGAGPLFNQNSFVAPGPGTHTLTLTLNTTAAQWVAACYIDGVQAGTNYTYTTPPGISAVGITQHTLTTPTAIQWNSFTVEATGTRSTNPVNASVSFSDTGVPLNPSFVGMSYEKKQLTTSLFSVNNAPVLKLFHMIGPAVIRVGGGTADQMTWNGTSSTTAITPSEVDAFAAFMNGLPSDWKVLYGINLETNTPANAADEATYAANDLGTHLLGFELGNEPEFYWNYSTFLPNWTQEESAITTTVPGWDYGKGGRGWIMDGADAGQGQLAAYTDPFASNESGVVSLLTQHYYVAVAGGGTMQAMLRYPNGTLDNLVTNIVGAAKGNQSLGARITEAGSFSSGGILGVSNALGAGLWSLDFMFTVAENGGQGVNFHGGGKSPYSPLNDNGTVVTSVGPEFYAMKLFSMIPRGGNVVPATVTLDTSANFSAYGVQGADGSVTALLNNKEVNDTVTVNVNLGSGVSSVALVSLTAPNLFDATGLKLGGATINTDGKWNGGVEAVLTATDGQLTVSVPPTTAYLLIPEKRQN